MTPRRSARRPATTPLTAAQGRDLSRTHHDRAGTRPPMSTTDQLQLFALPDLPMVRAGDDLAELIIASLTRANRTLSDHDVLVVAQKIVSKSENRTVDLATITP